MTKDIRVMGLLGLLILLGLPSVGHAQAKPDFELLYHVAPRDRPLIHAFKLFWGSEEANLQRIDVLVPETQEVIQSIPIPQDRVRIPWRDLQRQGLKAVKDHVFSQSDYNFDQFADVRLMLTYPPAFGEKRYLIYLFDLKKNQYVLNEELSALPSPVPQPKSKRVESHTLGLYGGFEWESKSFSFGQAGKLQLETTVVQKVKDAYRGSWQKEVKSRRQGQLQLLCRITAEPEGVPRLRWGSRHNCASYLESPRPRF